MPVETLLMMLVSAIVCVLFYLAAERVYNIHYKLKAAGSPLSKLVTGDRKKIDDKELWIRRYRAKVLVLLAAVIIVPPIWILAI